VKATTADKKRGTAVVLKVLIDFKSLSLLGGKYVHEINILDCHLSPFTGEIIPIYRRKHPCFQDESSLFPGENIPVSRRPRKKASPFPGDCDKARIYKVLSPGLLNWDQTNIPVSRRYHPHFQEN
jgi:hypothetical protein